MILRQSARRSARRSGATLVESAIIYSVVFFILFGIVIGAIAIFRYQQAAHMAREGSRWASVRGWSYEREDLTGVRKAATADEIRAHAAAAGGVDPSAIRCFVTWDTDNRTFHTENRNDTLVAVSNNVIVTIEYDWDPGIPLLGPYTLRSTSVSMMHY